AVLVVRVQHSLCNPSPPLCLDFISPLKGFVGLSVLLGEGVIGSLGKWELVKVSCEMYWRGGLELKTGGEGGMVFWRQVVMVRGCWLCLKEKIEDDARIVPLLLFSFHFF
ncbi:hypothetical protein Tco_0310914, partial [Tanacetum coccineum]